jgi:hypothetical protein
MSRQHRAYALFGDDVSARRGAGPDCPHLAAGRTARHERYGLGAGEADGDGDGADELPCAAALALSSAAFIWVRSAP